MSAQSRRSVGRGWYRRPCIADPWRTWCRSRKSVRATIPAATSVWQRRSALATMTESNPIGLSLRIRQDSRPEPGGRLGAVWPTREGGQCGHAIVSPSGRWLVWHQLGLFRIGSPRWPVVVDGWPLSGLAEDTFADGFANEVQPILLQALGCEAMHGSAVLLPTGVLAICGQSESGKSTLAYALAQKGRAQVADDHVIFDFRNGVPAVVPLPFQSSLKSTVGGALWCRRRSAPSDGGNGQPASGGHHPA